MANDVLLARWADIGDKILKAAEEFPAAQYEFRPAPDVRSFASQLRHVAFWNRYAAEAVRGGTPDGDANELARDQYPDKPKIVKALRDSFEELKGALGNGKARSNGSALDTVVSFIEHNGEHYGQLVLYYRLKGLVPPASR
jgi:hypothetical protein